MLPLEDGECLGAVLVDAAHLDIQAAGIPMTYQPNVLLLDQDHVLRRATALLLCNRGALVSQAATLEEAISLSLECAYDVALIDLAPGLPGAREILARLRREGAAPRRTVFCADEPISSDSASDASEVLLKPYAFGRLLSTIFVDAGPRSSERSGVFPRLRLIRGDLGRPQPGAAHEQGADAAGGVAPEGDAAETRAAASRGGAAVEARGAAVVRLQRRARSGPSGRAIRSTRRAPRGARHPG
ncbi:response regulator [Sorangium sp. So ce131]|uniref:response regulator n=1 Tax=Sorangium sp. So ce131 TaxID=3133282 RepID=UPI003F60B44D